ncbi:hypothetical protein LZ554_006262 [Drepanopeziza brunnea f. sp. 'monogermtubi']|nr:hypothetical protein LZ554_006262 [Drepanopeziza brunnea f. sp. 'monogermtubi']
MMFTNTIVAVAALAASVVTAAPGVQATAAIKLCDHFNWVACRELPYTPKNCAEVPDDFNDVISSLDTYNRKCTFFVDRYCKPEAGSFPYQGSVQNIRDYPNLGHFENAISSFNCDS